MNNNPPCQNCGHFFSDHQFVEYWMDWWCNANEACFCNKFIIEKKNCNDNVFGTNNLN